MKPSKIAQLILILILSAILLSIVGCASFRQKRIDRICATCPDIVKADSVFTETTITTIRDSNIVIPADSSWYFALIECINGKPVIKKERQKDGQRSRLNVEIDSDGLLSVRGNCDSLIQVIQIKDTDRQRLIQINKELVSKINQPKRFGENLFYWTGFIVCSFISLVFLILLILILSGREVKFLGIKRNRI